MRFSVRPDRLFSLLLRPLEGRSFASLFRSSPPLRLEDGDTEEQVLLWAADPSELVHEYGRTAVLSFFRDRLWTALGALPERRNVVEARLRVAGWMAEALALSRPREALSWARRGASLLPKLGLLSSSNDRISAKREARDKLAMTLGRCVRAMAESGDADGVVQACELLARIKVLTRQENIRYAHALRRVGARSFAARWIDLKCDETGSDNILSSDSWKDLQFLAETKGTGRQPVEADATQRLLLAHRSVLAWGPDPLQCHAIGIGYLNLDQNQKAMQYLVEATREADSRGEGWFHLGQAHFRLKDYPKASEAFRTAQENGLRRSQVVSWQAISYLKDERYDQALQLFEGTDSEIDSDAEVQLQWGRACYLSGLLDQAQSRFDRALEIDSREWRALLGWALCRARSGKVQEAITRLRNFEATTRDPAPIRFLLGRLLLTEDIPQAIQNLRNAFRSNPDPDYRLALALALDRADEEEVWEHFIQIALETPHPEIHRRLWLRAREAGDNAGSRFWLLKLRSSAPESEAVSALWDRELFSQAVAIYNRGDFTLAVKRLEDSSNLLSEPAAKELLARSLTWGAVSKLGKKTAEPSAWRDIERAERLSDAPEVRLLGALASLFNGDSEGARGKLALVLDDSVDRSEWLVLSSLTACLSGASLDEGLLQAVQPEFPQFGSLSSLLQVQASARRGDYRSAAQEILRWEEKLNIALLQRLPKVQLNVVVAACLSRGLRRASQGPRVLAKLGQGRKDGYWQPAHVLLRFYGTASRGTDGISDERIEECDRAFRDLLVESDEAEKVGLDRLFAKWLRFRILVAFRKGDFVAVLRIFDRLDRLSWPIPEPWLKLRQRIQKKMSSSSHAAAYALLVEHPDVAQQIWTKLVRRKAGELTSLHHLACLNWSLAHEAVHAGRTKESFEPWSLGLEYYRRLYSRPEYFDALREKGKSLMQPGRPFDEGAFESWVVSVLFERASVLVDLACHSLTQNDVEGARRAMEVIRDSKLDRTMKEGLSVRFAERRLDPDPLALSDFDAAILRAEQVIAVDEGNIEARLFALRATTHEVRTRIREKSGGFAQLKKMMKRVEGHADWLEGIVRAGPAEAPNGPSVAADYFDTLSELLHEEGYEEIRALNELLRERPKLRTHAALHTNRSQLRSHLLSVRHALQCSDVASKRALRLLPSSFDADRRTKMHESEYPTIENHLANL